MVGGEETYLSEKVTSIQYVIDLLQMNLPRQSRRGDLHSRLA
jgi:hypothetical protein